MSGRVWWITAASQTGSSHLRRGEACGDAFAWRKTPRGLIIAVADGAGSARLGGVGSAITASNAVRIAAFALDREPLGTGPFPASSVRGIFAQTLDCLSEAMASARNGSFDGSTPAAVDPGKEPARFLFEALRTLYAETGASEAELRDLHTTLLLAVLTPEGLSAGNIGDGWLVSRRTGEEARCVAAPQPGEQANETFFLDSPGALDDAIYDCIAAHDVDSVALLSDGSARFAIDLASGRPGKALFSRLFAFAADPSVPQSRRDAELADLLASDRICSASDDDKTIVLAASSAG